MILWNLEVPAYIVSTVNPPLSIVGILMYDKSEENGMDDGHSNVNMNEIYCYFE